MPLKLLGSQPWIFGSKPLLSWAVHSTRMHFSRKLKTLMEYDCFITFKPFLLRLIVVWLENSQCVHEGKFTLFIGWCWSCSENAFCLPRKEIWLWFKTCIINSCFVQFGNPIFNLTFPAYNTFHLPKIMCYS